MESTVFGKTVYGGVLQFTSPAPDSAYLPQWMMEHLQAKDGEEVTFKHVDLPKGEFVQLQPVSSSWLVSAWPTCVTCVYVHVCMCVYVCAYSRPYHTTREWLLWSFSFGIFRYVSVQHH